MSAAVNLEFTAAAAAPTGQVGSQSGQPFNLAPWPTFSLPGYVTAEHGALASAFLNAANDISRSRPGQNREDTLHHVLSRLYASTRRTFVGLHPDVVAARKALQAVGNEKTSPKYVEARTKLDDAVAVVEADTIRSLDAWTAAVCDKLRDDHEALLAKRGANALVAVATLAETVPVITEAFAEIEAVRERHLAAVLALGRIHPNIGRFNCIEGVRAFNDAMDQLRRAQVPLTEVRKVLYPPSDGAKRGRPRKSTSGKEAVTDE